MSDARAAFRRYEEIRARLPVAGFATTSLQMPSLADAADRWDGFVLDAFGVLNVRETAIPGAVARIAELRARGKRLCVLTNAASYTRAALLAKYHRLGYDFALSEVVSSRDVAAQRIAACWPGAHWAAISADGDSFADLPLRLTDAIAEPQAFDTADANLFLSSNRWTPALQETLARALSRAPRPVVVANPDLVAPRKDGLSQEPGLFAHDLIDRLGTEVHWFGKPYPEGFADACDRTGLSPDRLTMVGDTLHTDVLGGAAAGMGTVLITRHGLFAGLDTAPFIAASGIVPDVIAPTT